MNYEQAIEFTAAAVHREWMAAKQAAGIHSRTFDQTGEELMVDYRLLSEEAKELDRVTVRTVFALAPTEALVAAIEQRGEVELGHALRLIGGQR